MWQNILVIAIVAVTAALVAWSFYRKFTSKSSCCGGCSGKGSCASGTPLSPQKDSGCGCSH